MSDDAINLAVKVIPGSSRNEVVGWLGASLKIKVSVPPERGKANKAVCTLLARLLDLPRARVQIVGGQLTPNKIVGIQGLSQADLMARLPRK